MDLLPAIFLQIVAQTSVFVSVLAALLILGGYSALLYLGVKCYRKTFRRQIISRLHLKDANETRQRVRTLLERGDLNFDTVKDLQESVMLMKKQLTDLMDFQKTENAVHRAKIKRLISEKRFPALLLSAPEFEPARIAPQDEDFLYYLIVEREMNEVARLQNLLSRAVRSGT